MKYWTIPKKSSRIRTPEGNTRRLLLSRPNGQRCNTMAKSNAKSKSAVKTVNPSANPIRLGNVGWDSKSSLYTGGTPINHFMKCVTESPLNEDQLNLARVLHTDEKGNVRNARSQSIVQLANTRGKLELEIVSCRSVNSTKAKAQDLNASELDVHDYIVFKRYLSAGSAKKLSNTRTPFFYLDLSEGIPTLLDVSFKVKESPFYVDFKKRVYEILEESAQHLTGNDMTCMVIYPLVMSTGRFIKNGQSNYSVIMSGDKGEYNSQVSLFRQYVDLANALGYKSCKVTKSIVEDDYDAKQELKTFISTIESEVKKLTSKTNRVENFQSEIDSLDSLKALMDMQNEIKEARLNQVREDLELWKIKQLNAHLDRGSKSGSRRTSKKAQQKAELEAAKKAAEEAKLQSQKDREEVEQLKAQLAEVMKMMKNQK